MSRHVLIRELQDGTGRACIHWLRVCSEGPIRTSGRVEQTAHGPLSFGGVVGTIACNPEQTTVQPQTRGQDIALCLHTIEPGDGVTCPHCRKTPEFIAAERQNRDNRPKEAAASPKEE